jgi:hypothetical protein
MEDIIIQKQKTCTSRRDKVKNTIDEKVIRPCKLENVLSRGDTSIVDPLDDVVNLELIAYNKRKKSIVKQT